MKKMFFSVLYLFFTVSITVVAQEAPAQNAFPVGAFMGNELYTAVLNSYNNSGMNTIVWRADTETKNFLENYDVMAFNLGSTDWINHYATGCYSRWESEENQTDTFKLGVKHILDNSQIVGQQASWNDAQCWSTLGLTGPQDSLVYGPHYFQAKTYRRVYPDYPINVIEFNARFNMALDYDPQEANPNDPVCKIKVMYRYYYWDKNNPANNHYVDTLFLERILTVADFPQDGSFKIFNFDNQTYQYDVTIFPPRETGRYSADILQEDDILFTDWLPGTGIQFCVDWLGNSSLGTLYVDYAEVYDNDGWNEFVNPLTQDTVINRIQTYVQSYSNWNNIKYWYAHDEPRSIDDFIPIRTVDSLVRAANGAPLITHFWEVNVEKNGDLIYQRFYNTVQPQKLMLDAYPFHTDTTEIGGVGSLVTKFQQSHNLQPGFYYVPQSFGWQDSEGNGWWRPDSSEMKATTMLALAFGSKGIMFSDYYSYYPITAIVDSLGNPSELWNVIHDNLAPRLRRTLGKKLLGLEYTGNYLQLQYFIPTVESPPAPAEFNYLTLGLYPSINDMNWHAGFFDRLNHPEDKYFMLVNLLTTVSKNIDVKVIPPVSGYNNYRFRNTEGQFDETFSTQIIKQLTHPKGEGYLYQVAPVVKYGGTLIANDTIKTGSVVLTDNMTIQNGVNLIINTSYTANDTITLEGTGFITGNGYFYLAGNGAVLINIWDRSIFKSKSGNYPKILWGKYPEGTPNYYKVYSRLNGGNWIFLAQVDSTVREFTDTTFNISSTSGSIVQKEYAVTAYVGLAETDFSNIVTYRTANFWSVTTSLVTNWQTLSVPVIVTDFAKATVWPTSTSAAFSSH